MSVVAGNTEERIWLPLSDSLQDKDDFGSIVWDSGSKIGHVLPEHTTLQNQVPFASRKLLLYEKIGFSSLF